MALTNEMIAANESLKGLTEEQVSTIVTLSQNDENVVIGEKIGDIYRRMDTTIEESTGIKRDGDEKTYNYLARATKAFAGKYSDYEEVKGKVATLTQEKAALEEKIAKGGDEALKTQYEELKKELANTKVQYTEIKGKYDTAEETHKKALSDYKINAEIAKARAELSIKSGMNEVALNALVGQAIANVRAMRPSFEEKNGVETLIFHNEDGTPMNNAENALAPFTAKELLEKQFRSMDLLEVKESKGAGGRGPQPKQLLSAATQQEATEIITKVLLEKGLVKGSSDFRDEMNKMWADNKISSLPLK